MHLGGVKVCDDQLGCVCGGGKSVLHPLAVDKDREVGVCRNRKRQLDLAVHDACKLNARHSVVAGKPVGKRDESAVLLEVRYVLGQRVGRERERRRVDRLGFGGLFGCCHFLCFGHGGSFLCIGGIDVAWCALASGKHAAAKS